MTNKTRNETPQDMLTGTTSPAYPSLSCLVSRDSRQDCQWQVAALICDRADCVPRGSSENLMFILSRRDHSRASLTKPEMDGLDGGFKDGCTTLLLEPHEPITAGSGSLASCNRLGQQCGRGPDLHRRSASRHPRGTC